MGPLEELNATVKYSEEMDRRRGKDSFHPLLLIILNANLENDEVLRGTLDFMAREIIDLKEDVRKLTALLGE